MMSWLLGPTGVLWSARPDLALSLAVSCPSGLPHIVRLRADLARAAFHTAAAVRCPSAPASVRHQCEPFGGAPPSHVYVGYGLIDCQCRPSIFCNPYFFLSPSATDLLDRFAGYVSARGLSFLAGSFGREDYDLRLLVGFRMPCCGTSRSG